MAQGVAGGYAARHRQVREPHEAIDTLLVWHNPGPWKRIVASKQFYQHYFAMPHADCIESFIDYRVPVEKIAAIAQFDGSVVTEKMSGEVSAGCHNEEANFLALNLMHDIVIGVKRIQEVRDYYGKAVLNYRRKNPTRYMTGLRFTPDARTAPDRDTPVLSDEELKWVADEAKAAP